MIVRFVSTSRPWAHNIMEGKQTKNNVSNGQRKFVVPVFDCLLLFVYRGFYAYFSEAYVPRIFLCHEKVFKKQAMCFPFYAEALLAKGKILLKISPV